MKKFASLLLCLMLVLSMSVVGITAVSAVEAPSGTGSLTLHKYEPNSVVEGKVKDDAKAVPGATFSAYKVFSFENGTFTITPAFMNAGIKVTDLVNTNVTESELVNGTSESNGYLGYGSTDKMEEQIYKIQKYVYNNNVTPTASATTLEDGTANFANLELGVYFVQETVVPAGYTANTQSFLVSIPQWIESTEVDDEVIPGYWKYDIVAYPKDDPIDVAKKIGDDIETGVDKDNYFIGDDVPFVVKADIPDYGYLNVDSNVRVTQKLLQGDLDGFVTVNGERFNGVNRFNNLYVEFTDTLSKGLSFKYDSNNDQNAITLKVVPSGTTLVARLEGKAELKKYVRDDSGNLTVTGDADAIYSVTPQQDGTTVLKVKVSWYSIDAYQGEDLQLNYTAQLNEDAVIGSANENNIKYSFVNDPFAKSKNLDLPTPNPDDPDPDPRDEVEDEPKKVYTYELDLTKLFNGNDAATEGVDASQVTFQILYDEVPLNFVETTEAGVYKVWNEEDTNKTVVTDIHPNSAGKLVVKGLDAADYKLVETSSIDGYTILAAPVTFTVNYDVDNDDMAKAVATALNLDGNADSTSKTGTIITLPNTDNIGAFKMTINNPKNQFNLPLTGGLGVWMFTIGGGIAMAGAIIFISLLRKKKSQA